MVHGHQHRGGFGGGNGGSSNGSGSDRFRLCARLSIPHRVFRCLVVLCCALCLTFLGLSWTLMSPRTDSSGRPFVRPHRVRPELRVPATAALGGTAGRLEPQQQQQYAGEGGGKSEEGGSVLLDGKGADGRSEEAAAGKDEEEEKEDDDGVVVYDDDAAADKFEPSLSRERGGGGRVVVVGGGDDDGGHHEADDKWKLEVGINDLPPADSDKGRGDAGRQGAAYARTSKTDAGAHYPRGPPEGDAAGDPRGTRYRPTLDNKVPQRADQDRALQQNLLPGDKVKVDPLPGGASGDRKDGLRDNRVNSVRDDGPKGQPQGLGLVRSQDQSARARSQETVRSQNQGSGRDSARLPTIQNAARDDVNRGPARIQDSAKRNPEPNGTPDRVEQLRQMRERMERMKEEDRKEAEAKAAREAAEREAATAREAAAREAAAREAAAKQAAEQAAREAAAKQAAEQAAREAAAKQAAEQRDTAAKAVHPPTTTTTTTTTKPRDYSADRSRQSLSHSQQQQQQHQLHQQQQPKVPVVLQSGLDPNGYRVDSCTNCFWSDFPALIDEPDYCRRHSAAAAPASQQGGAMTVLLLISTAPANADKRAAIRRTWGSRCQDPSSAYRCLFVLGDSGSAADNERIRRESQQHRDILQFSFLDSYANLTYKTATSLHWAARNCIQVGPGSGGRSLTRYVMKTDDDMYVNTDLIPVMLTAAPAQRFVGGYCWGTSSPNRDVSSKWYVPLRSFRRSSFPPMCSGTGYLLSHDVVVSALNASQNIPFFHLEDVYMALCLQAVGVRPVRLRGFNNIFVNFQPCEYRRNVMTSHQVPTAVLERYWEMAHQCPGTDPSAEELFVKLSYPPVN